MNLRNFRRSSYRKCYNKCKCIFRLCNLDYEDINSNNSNVIRFENKEEENEENNEEENNDEENNEEENNDEENNDEENKGDDEDDDKGDDEDDDKGDEDHDGKENDSNGDDSGRDGKGDGKDSLQEKMKDDVSTLDESTDPEIKKPALENGEIDSHEIDAELDDITDLGNNDTFNDEVDSGAGKDLVDVSELTNEEISVDELVGNNSSSHIVITSTFSVQSHESTAMQNWTNENMAALRTNDVQISDETRASDSSGLMTDNTITEVTDIMNKVSSEGIVEISPNKIEKFAAELGKSLNKLSHILEHAMILGAIAMCASTIYQKIKKDHKKRLTFNPSLSPSLSPSLKKFKEHEKIKDGTGGLKKAAKTVVDDLICVAAGTGVTMKLVSGVKKLGELYKLSKYYGEANKFSELTKIDTALAPKESEIATEGLSRAMKWRKIKSMEKAETKLNTELERLVTGSSETAVEVVDAAEHLAMSEEKLGQVAAEQMTVLVTKNALEDSLKLGKFAKCRIVGSAVGKLFEVVLSVAMVVIDVCTIIEDFESNAPWTPARTINVTLDIIGAIGDSIVAVCTIIATGAAFIGATGLFSGIAAGAMAAGAATGPFIIVGMVIAIGAMLLKFLVGYIMGQIADAEKKISEADSYTNLIKLFLAPNNHEIMLTVISTMINNTSVCDLKIHFNKRVSLASFLKMMLRIKRYFDSIKLMQDNNRLKSNEVSTWMKDITNAHKVNNFSEMKQIIDGTKLKPDGITKITIEDTKIYKIFSAWEDGHQPMDQECLCFTKYDGMHNNVMGLFGPYANRPRIAKNSNNLGEHSGVVYKGAKLRKIKDDRKYAYYHDINDRKFIDWDSDFVSLNTLKYLIDQDNEHNDYGSFQKFISNSDKLVIPRCSMNINVDKDQQDKSGIFYNKGPWNDMFDFWDDKPETDNDKLKYTSYCRDAVELYWIYKVLKKKFNHLYAPYELIDNINIIEDLFITTNSQTTINHYLNFNSKILLKNNTKYNNLHLHKVGDIIAQTDTEEEIINKIYKNNDFTKYVYFKSFYILFNTDLDLHKAGDMLTEFGKIVTQGDEIQKKIKNDEENVQQDILNKKQTDSTQIWYIHADTSDVFRILLLKIPKIQKDDHNRALNQLKREKDRHKQYLNQQNQTADMIGSLSHLFHNIKENNTTSPQKLLINNTDIGYNKYYKNLVIYSELLGINWVNNYESKNIIMSPSNNMLVNLNDEEKLYRFLYMIDFNHNGKSYYNIINVKKSIIINLIKNNYGPLYTFDLEHKTLHFGSFNVKIFKSLNQKDYQIYTHYTNMAMYRGGYNGEEHYASLLVAALVEEVIYPYVIKPAYHEIKEKGLVVTVKDTLKGKGELAESIKGKIKDYGVLSNLLPSATASDSANYFPPLSNPNCSTINNTFKKNTTGDYQPFLSVSHSMLYINYVKLLIHNINLVYQNREIILLNMIKYEYEIKYRNQTNRMDIIKYYNNYLNVLELNLNSPSIKYNVNNDILLNKYTDTDKYTFKTFVNKFSTFLNNNFSKNNSDKPVWNNLQINRSDKSNYLIKDFINDFMIIYSYYHRVKDFKEIYPNGEDISPDPPIQNFPNEDDISPIKQLYISIIRRVKQNYFNQNRYIELNLENKSIFNYYKSDTQHGLNYLTTIVDLQIKKHTELKNSGSKYFWNFNLYPKTTTNLPTDIKASYNFKYTDGTTVTALDDNKKIYIENIEKDINFNKKDIINNEFDFNDEIFTLYNVFINRYYEYIENIFKPTIKRYPWLSNKDFSQRKQKPENNNWNVFELFQVPITDSGYNDVLNIDNIDENHNTSKFILPNYEYQSLFKNYDMEYIYNQFIKNTTIDILIDILKTFKQMCVSYDDVSQNIYNQIKSYYSTNFNVFYLSILKIDINTKNNIKERIKYLDIDLAKLSIIQITGKADSLFLCFGIPSPEEIDENTSSAEQARIKNQEKNRSMYNHIINLVKKYNDIITIYIDKKVLSDEQDKWSDKSLADSIAEKPSGFNGSQKIMTDIITSNNLELKTKLLAKKDMYLKPYKGRSGITFINVNDDIKHKLFSYIYKNYTFYISNNLYSINRHTILGNNITDMSEIILQKYVSYFDTLFIKYTQQLKYYKNTYDFFYNLYNYFLINIPEYTMNENKVYSSNTNININIFIQKLQTPSTEIDIYYSELITIDNTHFYDNLNKMFKFKIPLVNTTDITYDEKDSNNIINYLQDKLIDILNNWTKYYNMLNTDNTIINILALNNINHPVNKSDTIKDKITNKIITYYHKSDIIHEYTINDLFKLENLHSTKFQNIGYACYVLIKNYLTPDFNTPIKVNLLDKLKNKDTKLFKNFNLNNTFIKSFPYNNVYYIKNIYASKQQYKKSNSVSSPISSSSPPKKIPVVNNNINFSDVNNIQDILTSDTINNILIHQYFVNHDNYKYNQFIFSTPTSWEKYAKILKYCKLYYRYKSKSSTKDNPIYRYIELDKSVDDEKYNSSFENKVNNFKTFLEDQNNWLDEDYKKIGSVDYFNAMINAFKNLYNKKLSPGSTDIICNLPYYFKIPLKHHVIVNNNVIKNPSKYAMENQRKKKINYQLQSMVDLTDEMNKFSSKYTVDNILKLKYFKFYKKHLGSLETNELKNLKINMNFDYNIIDKNDINEIIKNIKLESLYTNYYFNKGCTKVCQNSDIRFCNTTANIPENIVAYNITDYYINKLIKKQILQNNKKSPSQKKLLHVNRDTFDFFNSLIQDPNLWVSDECIEDNSKCSKNELNIQKSSKPPINIVDVITKTHCKDKASDNHWGTCEDYEKKQWCKVNPTTGLGQNGETGAGWNSEWGFLSNDKKNNCCACGGGNKYEDYTNQTSYYTESFQTSQQNQTLINDCTSLQKSCKKTIKIKSDNYCTDTTSSDSTNYEAGEFPKIIYKNKKYIFNDTNLGITILSPEGLLFFSIIDEKYNKDFFNSIQQFICILNILYASKHDIYNISLYKTIKESIPNLGIIANKNIENMIEIVFYLFNKFNILYLYLCIITDLSSLLNTSNNTQNKIINNLLIYYNSQVLIYQYTSKYIVKNQIKCNNKIFNISSSYLCKKYILPDETNGLYDYKIYNYHYYELLKDQCNKNNNNNYVCNKLYDDELSNNLDNKQLKIKHYSIINAYFSLNILPFKNYTIVYFTKLYKIYINLKQQSYMSYYHKILKNLDNNLNYYILLYKYINSRYYYKNLYNYDITNNLLKDLNEFIIIFNKKKFSICSDKKKSLINTNINNNCYPIYNQCTVTNKSKLSYLNNILGINFINIILNKYYCFNHEFMNADAEDNNNNVISPSKDEPKHYDSYYNKETSSDLYLLSEKINLLQQFIKRLSIYFVKNIFIENNVILYNDITRFKYSNFFKVYHKYNFGQITSKNSPSPTHTNSPSPSHKKSQMITTGNYLLYKIFYDKIHLIVFRFHSINDKKDFNDIKLIDKRIFTYNKNNKYYEYHYFNKNKKSDKISYIKFLPTINNFYLSPSLTQKYYEIYDYDDNISYFKNYVEYNDLYDDLYPDKYNKLYLYINDIKNINKYLSSYSIKTINNYYIISQKKYTSKNLSPKSSFRIKDILNEEYFKAKNKLSDFIVLLNNINKNNVLDKERNKYSLYSYLNTKENIVIRIPNNKQYIVRFRVIPNKLIIFYKIINSLYESYSKIIYDPNNNNQYILIYYILLHYLLENASFILTEINHNLQYDIKSPSNSYKKMISFTSFDNLTTQEITFNLSYIYSDLKNKYKGFRTKFLKKIFYKKINNKNILQYNLNLYRLSKLLYTHRNLIAKSKFNIPI